MIARARFHSATTENPTTPTHRLARPPKVDESDVRAPDSSAVLLRAPQAIRRPAHPMTTWSTPSRKKPMRAPVLTTAWVSAVSAAWVVTSAKAPAVSAAFSATSCATSATLSAPSSTASSTGSARAGPSSGASGLVTQGP